MSADGLVGVEARHLAALQAIAEERSFSRAAERLGYAQSAVSQQIATLERAVGLKLVERPGGPRPVSLTEAGEVVLRHADRLLARLGALRADLDQLVAGESGTDPRRHVPVGRARASCPASSAASARAGPRCAWRSARSSTSRSCSTASPRARSTSRSPPPGASRARAARERDAARGPLRAARAARQSRTAGARA